MPGNRERARLPKGGSVLTALTHVGAKVFHCSLLSPVAGPKPQRSRPDNAYVESFNGTFRAKCLDAHWFATPTEARKVIEAWHQDNENRPHRAPGERMPNEIAKEFVASSEFFDTQIVGDSLCPSARKRVPFNGTLESLERSLMTS